MAVYGVDYYGKAFYGAPVVLDYAVRDLAARQLGFGYVRVSWTAPTPNVWTQLALVRSQYGFPVSVTDGQLLATFNSTQAATSFDDAGLTPGYWYYALFAAVPLAAWSAQLTYQAGDRVSYSAQNWICLQTAAPGQIPVSGSGFWALSQESAIWQPAGAVATMAVADHGYAAVMAGLIPAAYKAAPVLSTDDQVVNDDLADFLTVLAFGFELVATELDDLFHLYGTSTTRYDRLAQISQMVGVPVESAASPRYQRLRTAQAAVLGRSKGTAAGLAALIEAATGLECTVSTGANLMLNRDQSDFPYPLYPQWETDESYVVGNLVSYLGAKYVCIAWAYTAVASDFTGSPNAVTTGSSPLAYTAEVSASAGAALTAHVTVPVTGTYLIAFTVVLAPDGGVVGVAVDGAAQVLGASSYLPQFGISPVGWHPLPAGDSVTTVETYAGATEVGNEYLVPIYLTAGTHAVTFTAATKNSSSTGYSIRVNDLVVTAQWSQYPPNATPPVNGGSSAGLQWSAASAAVQPSYANAITGQSSTWTGTSPAVLNISYLGSVGLSIDANYLTASGLTAGNVYTLSSAAVPQIQTYSGAASYTAGQIVTGSDGLQYTALTATTGTPPPDPGTWQRTSYQFPYDRELIAHSAAPMRPAPVYDPHASYAEGAMVQYNGALFVTPGGASGITPPASPGSNSGWEYWGPAAAKAVVASFFIPQPVTGHDTVYPGIEFFDVDGQPVASPSMMGSTGTVTTTLPVYARLIEPTADLSGRLFDTAANSWTVSPTGFWQISSGVCAASPTYTGFQRIRLAYTTTGTSDARVGATFATEVADHTVRDVGLVFRLSDTTHFLAAFRDQIVEYNGGTTTQLASYTRLAAGTRMYLDLLGSTVKLYAYTGSSAAPVLVTTVTSTFNQSAGSHGLVDWEF